MASTIYLAPTANFISKTLNGAITDAVTTITLNNTTSLQTPGYAVIDRTNSAGTSTPNSREVILYTGISGNDLTGVTRAADGSTARSHSDGAIVEFNPTIGMWNSLATIVSAGFTGDGYLKAINSPVSIAIGRLTQFDTPSIASITRIENKELVNVSLASIQQLDSPFIRASSVLVSIATIRGHLSTSGASTTGFVHGLNPVWRTSGSYSGPTTFVGGILVVPKAANLQWVSIITRFVVSTASVGFDIQKNGSSIFPSAVTRPAIAAGGTYVSTASINTTNIVGGDRLTASVNSVGTDGFVTDLTIQAGAI